MNSLEKQAEEQHQLGLQCVKQENLVAAKIHFTKAIQHNPTNPRYHNDLAKVYKMGGEFSQAEKHYLIAVQLNPDYVDAHHNLANLYALQNNFVQALKQYVKTIHLAPDYSEAHHNLGLLLLKYGKADEALKQFNNVIALNSQALMAHYHLANIYFTQEKYEQAQHHYEQVLALDPEFTAALNNLGAIYLQQKKPQLAIDYFTKVLALDEKNIEARSNIAAAFLQYDRYENAIRHYQELLRDQPDNIEINFNIAIAYMSLGHLSEAISHYKKILSIDPQHVDTLSNLGVIYLRLEQRDKAKVYFQQAQKLQPNNPIVNYLLDAVSPEPYSVKAPVEYIQNLFDHYALYYDKHLLKTLHYQVPFLIRDAVIAATGQRAAKWRVLDLGCGTGLSGEIIKTFAEQLVGIDLSAKMLEEAGKKNIYDELHVGDFTELLKNKYQQYPPFDLIIAADVLGYIGDLATVFERCAAVLKPGGLWVFSIEKTTHYPFTLQPNARFAHTQTYIHELAKTYHFVMLSLSTQVGRRQNEEVSLVDVVVLQLRNI